MVKSMKTAFRNVILFGKRHRESLLAKTLLELKKHLEQQQLNVFIEQETAKLFKIKKCQTIQERKLKETDGLIIVIGGDGSLLNAARLAAQHDMPVLGINRGKLGFLTDISPEAFSEIDQILRGEFQQEKRFLLKAQVVRGKKIIGEQLALNDVVLLPGDVAHMISFSIEIDGQFMCTQRADGLICTTPTGSTAYALSGGGPILHPSLNAVALVPMFPHKLTSRPIVISGESEISITVSPENEALPKISCDGQAQIALKPNDIIQIKKYEHPLILIHPKNYQYFSTLRSKLQWESKAY